jgi:Spy/CpxP family protein refolding chaperone
MIAAVVAVAVAAQAGEGKKKQGDSAPAGRKAAMHDQLMPPKAVEALSLTADQKSKLDELNAAFKKDADAWEQAHPDFKDQFKKAREDKDKEAMKKLMEERKPVMEARKKYIEQFKGTLTDEQKQKMAEMRAKMSEGRGPKGPKADKTK